MSLQRNLTIISLVAIIGVLGVVAGLSFAGAGDGGDAPGDINRTGDECEVTINFNDTVTQTDIEEVEAMLRALDPDVEFFVMESFPPIGVGRLNVDDRSQCDAAVDELRAKSYTANVSWQTFDPLGVENPDEPVSTTSGG
jgi:hypothetical protein